jgi:ADP-heptose:LPS heptosyltransferase
MKVLLIRLSSIGDIVLTTPIIRCVKTQLGAEVHFITKAKFIPILNQNPYIDQIKIWDERDSDINTATLQAENYDIIIDLHKNIRTRRLKRKLQTPWISYKKLNIQKWLFVNFKINILPKKHIVDRYFDALKKIEVYNDGNGLDYFLSSDNTELLLTNKLVTKNYTAIAIGGTYATKQMPVSLILELIKRLNTTIVLVGSGESDAKKALEITMFLPYSTIINLCNRLSLDQSACIVKNAERLITGDTGLMHIASAFDTPIQAIWGNTHPILGMYAYRKTNVSNHQVDLKCNPCSKLGSKKCPRGHFDCMNKQNVVEIVKNCRITERIQ